MSESLVIVRKQGRAGRLTLNRPKALHALNMEMCATMLDALKAWAHDDTVEFVFLDHAEGTRGFCAGGDVLMLAESGRGDGKLGTEFFDLEYRLNTVIHEYPKPYIALLDGVTMGGGAGISVHGSHRIATERTLFAMPEAQIGLIPDVGGGYFLPRLDHQLGMWLALTGDRLKGKDTLAAGVATHFISSEDIPDLLDNLSTEGLSRLSSLETSATGSYSHNLPEIETAFSAGSVQKVLDALSTGSEWGKKAAETIKSKAPIAVALAFHQLRKGTNLSFRDVMRMEKRVASRMIQGPSFQEGVRALLIDKDQSPKWEPSSLSDITFEMIEGYFQPLDLNELEFEELN